MGDIARYRGPDDEGFYQDARVAFGMRRLSIIDLSGGHQPIANEDQTLWVVCNGEIYNFRALRVQLERAGHVFRTNSDTEVIVHAYELWGDDFVRHLDGMFGFALWDKRRRRLLLGRDRLGIKPLYVHQDSRRLLFASEAKAILEVPGVPRILEPVALDQYLALGYVPAPYTLIKGIRKLPPASLMICEAGKVRTRQYWRYSAGAEQPLGEIGWSRRVRETLERAVVSQMVSDVPLGAFLSGGIDSSTVVALMARHSDRPIKTYAIGFDAGEGGAYYNELPYARRVAELFRTDHKEIIVKPDVVGLLPRLLWHLDEPIADAAFVTTFLVAEFARQDVTVILSGVGGDELFGGYRRYQGAHYAGYYNRLPAWLRRGVVQPLARRLPSDRHSPLMNFSRQARSFILANELGFEDRYRTYVQVFDRAQRDALLGAQRRNGFDALDQAFYTADRDNGVARLIHVDLLTQLPDDLLMLTDKMTMATSIECRVPLLDQELVELAAAIPAHLKVRGRCLKFILKRAVADLLPQDILQRGKRGFGAPMGAWLKRELAPLMRRLLSREAIVARGLFRPEAIAQVIASHMASREDRTDHLLALINLELWCRLYLDRSTPEDISSQMTEDLAA